MQKSINRQSGFAIGTILLAVVLIAAIVSAIAIASRGSQGQSNRENARVQASTLVQQGVNLRNGFERMVSTGTNPVDITATAGASRANIVSSADAADCTTATAPLVCLYSNPDGGAARQVPPNQAFVTAPGAGTATNSGRYRLLQLVTIPGVGNGASNIIMFIAGIRDDVCRQINNLVVGASNNTAIPVPTAVFTTALSAAETATGTDLTGLTWTGVTTPNLNEACFLSAATGGVNVYYKVMSERVN